MCLNFLVSCDASKILRVFKVHLERNTSKPSKICGEFLAFKSFRSTPGPCSPKGVLRRNDPKLTNGTGASGVSDSEITGSEAGDSKSTKSWCVFFIMFFPQISLAIRVLTSNRRGGLATNFGGVHVGCHCWVAFFF